MDRKRSRRSFDQGAMRPGWIAESPPLLPSRARRSLQSSTHEAHRRNLHREALSWLQGHYAEIAKRGLRRQSQTNSRAHAKNGVGRDATRTQYVQKSPRTSEISLFAKRPANFKPSASVEYRYNVYSVARRVYLSHSCDRLVQSTGPSISAFKQFGRHVLHRGCRGSNREVRKTRNFQYRPGGAVFFPPICRCCIEQRDSLQHGWTGTRSRQCFCGTPLESREI